MVSVDSLLSNTDNLDVFSENLSQDDIAFLVGLLVNKHDNIHYAAFLTLQKRSVKHGDVYPFWETFAEMMSHQNSYHRSIGIMLIAENVRHDSQRKLDGILDEYLSHCRDEKFITCRQTIQSIGRWIALRPDLFEKVAEHLMSINIESFKDTQNKLILLDILKTLAVIDKEKEVDGIRIYLHDALLGGYLDKKAKKELEVLFGGVE